MLGRNIGGSVVGGSRECSWGHWGFGPEMAPMAMVQWLSANELYSGASSLIPLCILVPLTKEEGGGICRRRQVARNSQASGGHTIIAKYCKRNYNVKNLTLIKDFT